MKGLVQPCQRRFEVNISMSPHVGVQHGAPTGLRAAQRVVFKSLRICPCRHIELNELFERVSVADVRKHE